MKAYQFERNALVLGGRIKTYETVIRYYRCDACGGVPVHKITDDGDVLECVICGGREFVREQAILEQCADAVDLLYKLPQNLRDLVAPQENVTAQQAISELFE